MKALIKLESPESKEQFISMYQAVHGVDKQQAEDYFEVEFFNFKKQIEESATFQQCTDLSIAGTFLGVISDGLSFEKSAGHIYMMPKSAKTAKGFEKRLNYTYAAQGLISLCTSAGSITGCSPATLVFEGDEIKVGSRNGETYVDHSISIPRKSDVILGGYCIVFLPNKNITFWMEIEEVVRLKKASAKQNKGKANALYTSGKEKQIDEGFLKTKIVKAALKNFLKKKTLTDTYEDPDVIIEEEDNIDDPITNHNNIPNLF